MSWQDMIVFSVVFHSVWHLFQMIKDYNNSASLTRILRNLSTDETPTPTIRRMK